MDKIAEYIKENLGVFAATCFGMFAPGALTIAVFRLELYLELDILKLLYLSAVISAPSFLILFMLTTTVEELKDYYDVSAAICVASIFNLFFFCVPLLIKMIVPSLTKSQFVLIIIFFLTACLVGTIRDKFKNK